MSIVIVEANNSGTTSEAISLARSHGYDTTLLTGQPQFYGQVPDNPIELCDRVIECDTYNVAEILRAIRGLDAEAVVAFDDYHLSVAALSAMALGLPHADIGGLVTARYKDLTRERTATTPGSVWAQVVAEGELAKVALDALPYPVIVKPLDESGSVEVRLCSRPEHVVAAFDDYRRHVVNVREYRPLRALMIEEFIDGDEYSCELYWDARDGWRVAGLTRKSVTLPPRFVEFCHLFPAPLPISLAERVEKSVVTWLDTIGLRAGAAHVEFRVKDDQVRLIEINPRLPGGQITQLVQWCTGINLVGRYLDFHLRGESQLSQGTVPEFAAAAARFVLPEEVAPRKTSREIYEHFTQLTTFQRGSLRPDIRAVDNSQSDYDRLGYVLLGGLDSDSVEADFEKLTQRLAS